MTRRWAPGLMMLPILLAPSARADGPPTPPAPSSARLRSHVATLTAPEFAGRRGEGARKAADYVADAFRALDLEPGFGDAFEQAIPGGDGAAPIGRNVAGRLPGSGPDLRDRWVVVSAHFDHLGVRNGVLYPGADDNASGVALMLEVARCLADAPARPRRSLLFVGFDREEDGLLGSRHFVKQSPVPLDKIDLFFTADMVGRALGGVCQPYVFVMGTEHAPALRPWVERAAAGLDLKVGLLGSDILLFDRSDYGPFRQKKIPYLFFSTGENPRYHRPTDTAETLDYGRLDAITALALGVIRRAAAADSAPSWTEPADHPLGEAVVVRDVLRILMDHREALGIGGTTEALIRNNVGTLDAIIERGQITPAERAKMVRMAQLVLYSVL